MFAFYAFDAFDAASASAPDAVIGAVSPLMLCWSLDVIGKSRRDSSLRGRSCIEVGGIPLEVGGILLKLAELAESSWILPNVGGIGVESHWSWKNRLGLSLTLAESLQSPIEVSRIGAAFNQSWQAVLSVR